MKGYIATVPELRVAKGDLGKVIGKQGNIAYAIRTILNATVTKLNQRAVLDIGVIWIGFLLEDWLEPMV